MIEEKIADKVEEKAVVESAQQATESKPSETVAKTEEDSQQQINWKKFREKRDQERRELEEQKKIAKKKEEEAAALKAAMDAILSKPSPKPQETYQYQEQNEETEDQRIEKKIQAALDNERRKSEQERIQREREELPSKLNKTFKDFDNVCSSSNLDYLEFHYPEVASAFSKVPDSFEKWADIYHSVKRFVPNHDSKKDENRAQKNMNKPQSMSVSGATQTSDGPPMILDEQRKANNYARMQKVMKGR